MFEFFRSLVAIAVPIFVISTMPNVGLTQRLSDITGHLWLRIAAGNNEVKENEQSWIKFGCG